MRADGRRTRPGGRNVAAALGLCVLAGLAGGSAALLSVCGPFTDVSDLSFCPFVLEVFTLGVTTGTTPATYDPASAVTRLQMAAFLSRSVDGLVRRRSRRAALQQFWTPQNAGVIGTTTVGSGPFLAQSDGKDVWVSNNTGGTVSRVRGSDARLLQTWTGAANAAAVLVAMNRILVTGETASGSLYSIDPSRPAGAVTTVASGIGFGPSSAAFDGTRVWIANRVSGSVSILTPGAVPWTVTTVTAGFFSPIAVLFAGSNVWASDELGERLVKLDTSGAILQTVTAPGQPEYPVFDGQNIWVPEGNDAVLVVRASTGAVLQTLTGNGLFGPIGAAFDGERILVTNFTGGSVSLWKATSLAPLGSFPTGPGGPYGACSDGHSFWIAMNTAGKLARF
jgi:hypothetical protein